MRWLDLFRSRKPEPVSASAAKERLQIVLAHERIGRTREDAIGGLAAVTGNCVACHALYRLDEAR